jgi:hypothetical protein
VSEKGLYTRFRDMRDDEIRADLDTYSRGTLDPQWYMDELRHRELASQARAMTRLTVVIAILTLANVVLVAVTLTR